jgi:hypothetical protein
MKTLERNLLNEYKIDFLYHMTHIDNLSTILKHGLLCHNNKYQKIDISDCDVNSRRNRKEPIYNKSIHSYVPFYINPRNAMLYKRREKQDEIVILVLKNELMINQGVLFTDGNASCSSTGFSNNLSRDITKLDWDCLKDNFWNNHVDGRRTRMAEVLVPNYVSQDNILVIIVSNTTLEEKIKEISYNTTVIIDKNKNIFF